MLFKKNEILKEAPVQKALTTELTPNGERFTVMGKKADILTAIDQLKPNHSLHYCTEGRWSSHELLARLLHLAGPSEVCITSWALTEDPIRMLVNMIEDGLITDVHLVTDVRIKVNSPNAYQLAKANFQNMLLANIHAKVFTITNHDWQINVVQSANFTRNKRFEAGIVTVDKTTTLFHSTWIKKLIANGSD